jgi:glucose/arabinose dehydrogenase
MTIRGLALCFLIGFLASCGQEASSVAGDKQEPVITEPEARNGGLFLPDGFEALVVADSVGLTRHLAVNTNGDIYVKLRITTGDMGNIALRDTNKDGRADIFQRFGDYPNDGSFATEMRIHKGYLYFSSEQVVYRQKLTPPRLIPDGKPEIIVIDQHPIQWHNAKSLAFDNRGAMYVTFSAPTNNCEDWTTITGTVTANVKGYSPCPELKDQAGIWKFDEGKWGQTQSDGQVFATGIRSVVGISWNEKDNSLYAIQHGRDYLNEHAPQYFSRWQSAVLPAEEFIKIKKGDNYGWPYCYYDPFKHKKLVAPEYGGDGIKEAKGYANPIMGLPAHWSPNDLLFYKGSQFPERYRDGAFIAFHGSANRAPYPQAGYVVAFIPFQNGKPMDKWEVFADGFAGVDTIKKMEDAKYRPMGLSEGPDGSLYVSESKKGKIWRILFKADRTGFGEAALINMEKRKSRTYLKIPDEKADNLSLK